MIVYDLPATTGLWVYLRAVCHNNSLMILRVSQASKKKYVETRKKCVIDLRNCSVQMHMYEIKRPPFSAGHFRVVIRASQIPLSTKACCYRGTGDFQ